jgi:hypothetical protein
VANLYINGGDLLCVGLFGYISGATIKNLGIENADVRGGMDCAGGIAGCAANSSVAGCYVSGTVTGNGLYAGGVAGMINSGAAARCYFAGTVSGTAQRAMGGVAGNLENASLSDCFSAGNVISQKYAKAGGIAGSVSGGSIANSYSTCEVSNSYYVGDVGGIAGAVSNASRITNSAALNPSLMVFEMSRIIGRVTSYYDGSSMLTNNAAFADMKILGIASGDADELHNGISITAGTLLTADFWRNAMSWPDSAWTFADGKLPGLFGKPTDPPVHLQSAVSVLSSDRVIPPAVPNQNAIVIAPVNQLTSEFTAGPNPVSKSTGMISFFRQGSLIDKGTLTIYDASGNVIRKINVNDNTIMINGNVIVGADGNRPVVRRLIGFWDLRDASGRSIPAGTYLIRGTVKTLSGNKEKISLIIGVR